jgi:hypothetical protein
MICNWDLEDKGKPLPITPDVVDTFCLPGLSSTPSWRRLAGYAQREQDEKKLSNVTSDAGSPRAGKRENARNGTSPSERRATWA